MFDRYEGLTHLVPHRLLPLWQRVMCRRQWHAFDEVVSSTDHCLSCDACGLSVGIAGIDRTYADPPADDQRETEASNGKTRARGGYRRGHVRDLLTVAELEDVPLYTVNISDQVRGAGPLNAAARMTDAGVPEYPAGLLDVMTLEQARIWWNSPQSAWSGATPCQVLPRIGEDAVLAAARRIARGDYS